MSIRSIVGVIVGAISDIVATGVLSAFLVPASVSAANLSGVEYQRAVERAMLDDPFLFTAQLLLGSACSVLGGYLAARIAKRNELLNGGLSSFLCLGFSVQALYVGGSLLPHWLHLAWLPITPALAVLGGYLCLRGKNAKQSA